MSEVMDFAATREQLREQLERAELELVDVRDRLGELALDVQLGSAPQADLEKARAQQVALTARASELQAALAAVDGREAEHVAAEAQKQRQADEKRLEELQRTCDAAGAQVIDLARQLGAALAAGDSAVQEADVLGRRLDANTVVIAQWPTTARRLINARLGHAGIFRPGEQEAAERALAGQT